MCSPRKATFPRAVKTWTDKLERGAECGHESAIVNPRKQRSVDVDVDVDVDVAAEVYADVGLGVDVHVHVYVGAVVDVEVDADANLYADFDVDFDFHRSTCRCGRESNVYADLYVDVPR